MPNGNLTLTHLTFVLCEHSTPVSMPLIDDCCKRFFSHDFQITFKIDKQKTFNLQKFNFLMYTVRHVFARKI